MTYHLIGRMRCLLFAILACGVGLAACKKAPPNDSSSPNQHAETPGKQMTDMDPSSEKAWQQARAIAAEVGGNDLEPRKGLPFMFMTSPKPVLVHKGAVVKERGPAAAGAYLRDLGIARGEGPEINDLLYVFYALDAWPPVKRVNREGFINVPDDKRLADLTAQTKHDGTSAQVILHYFLPENLAPSEDDEGDDEGDSGGPVVRQLVRATLDIPATGDSSWKVETISWTEPE